MVNALFTMNPPGPTPPIVVPFFLALAAIAQPPARPVGTIMPARATVRIVSGARVHLGPSSNARMIKAMVRIEDGQRRPAHLIEFE